MRQSSLVTLLEKPSLENCTFSSMLTASSKHASIELRVGAKTRWPEGQKSQKAPTMPCWGCCPHLHEESDPFVT